MSVLSNLGKAAGAALAGYGVDVSNWRNITIGSAIAIVLHFIDSIWNSPKGEQPS